MSDRKKHKTCGQLTDAFKKAVTDYMLVETELAPADIAMVFGSNGRESLSEKAAELYQRKLVKKIVVSGGVHNGFQETEALDIYRRLIDLGVPAEDILVENRARNTGENVIYSKKIIERQLGLEKVESIIAVGNVTASRRFLMTLKRHWPEAFVMIAPANPYDTPKEKWFTVEKFKSDVLKQYNRIPSYIKRGFIVEVDIDEINRKAIEKRKFG